MDTLEITTRPGDTIELWRWSDSGSLEFFDAITHEENIGPLMLPTGGYVYYVISEIGQYNND